MEMADAVTRHNSGIEEEFGDWNFALTRFVGTENLRLLLVMKIVAHSQKGKESQPTKPETGGHAFSATTWLSWRHAWHELNFGDTEHMQTKLESSTR